MIIDGYVKIDDLASLVERLEKAKAASNKQDLRMHYSRFLDSRQYKRGLRKLKLEDIESTRDDVLKAFVEYKDFYNKYVYSNRKERKELFKGNLWFRFISSFYGEYDSPWHLSWPVSDINQYLYQLRKVKQGTDFVISMEQYQDIEDLARYGEKK